MTAAKPHYLVIAGRPVQAPRRETPLEAACRRHGKPFGVQAWPTGEGAAYWTSERVARLAAQNEELRMRRKVKP